MRFSRRELAKRASLTEPELEEVWRCRRRHNRLGFAYQLVFVRVLNRFPAQVPFEQLDDLVLFAAIQLGLDPSLIDEYQAWQSTLSRHQQRIIDLLGLRRFDDDARHELEVFVFEAATRLEQNATLRKRAEEFLAEQRVLRPADSTIARIVGEQRQRARDHIFGRVAEAIPAEVAQKLEQLLVVADGETVSPLQAIKANPGQPSVASMHVALRKLKWIEDTGVLALDLSWLNSNYQRALFHKVRKSSAHRLRDVKEPVRHAALACFLWQSYGDAVDQAVLMFSKLLTKMESKASAALDEAMREERKSIRRGLAALAVLGPLLLDETIPETEIRERFFDAIPREDFVERVALATEWVSGRKSDHLHMIVDRYRTLRKYSPAFLDAIAMQQEGRGENGPTLEALATLRTLNATNKRKVPADAPTEFLSKRWQALVGSGDEISRPAWECAVLLKARDDIRTGNIAVEHSKRFGHLDDLFIPEEQWVGVRDRFFARSKLPAEKSEVPAYLEQRLTEAYDRFLAAAPTNAYASVNDKGWRLSTDPTERLSAETDAKLTHLKKWLKAHVRGIRLPDLLIEVDNELGFTQHFMPASRRAAPDPEEVCTILAAVMAQGCNIGPHTMARLTSGVTYDRLKRVSDWQLTRDTQREALAVLVKAISGLDTSLYWGEGKTSASDGQRWRFRRRVLQKTYSPRFSDFALEFYTFVADNYAPFYSTPIECSDRDAATVLDGLLYNESDLELEEHYTDTHGYTEINFAAFAMLGRRFSPRIRGIKKQRLYRVDDRDYGALASLVGRADRKIDLRRIASQWDRLGRFYASLECGHTTASVALRRLAGFSAKNRFYRANRDLGRVLKTEFILDYMSEPELRTRIRRGLLKVEELHALARDVFYGNRGRVDARELWEQMNSCSSLTLIVACIIYWQAREMSRAIRRGDPDGHGVELALLQHVSPVVWDNVVALTDAPLDRCAACFRRGTSVAIGDNGGLVVLSDEGVLHVGRVDLAEGTLSRETIDVPSVLPNTALDARADRSGTGILALGGVREALAATSTPALAMVATESTLETAISVPGATDDSVPHPWLHGGALELVRFVRDEGFSRGRLRRYAIEGSGIREVGTIETAGGLPPLATASTPSVLVWVESSLAVIGEADLRILASPPRTCESVSPESSIHLPTPLATGFDPRVLTATEADGRTYVALLEQAPETLDTADLVVFDLGVCRDTTP